MSWKRNLIVLAALSCCVIAAWKIGNKLPLPIARSSPAATHSLIDISTHNFVAKWIQRPEQRAADGAPAIGLLIEPSDMPGWRYGSKFDTTMPLENGAPSLIELSIQSPNADSTPDISLAEICPTEGQFFLDGCLASSARLILSRDDMDLNMTDILLGVRPPRQYPVNGYARTPGGLLATFWTREDERTGRTEWLGWGCRAGAMPEVPHVFEPSRVEKLAHYQRCYAPTLLNRLWPWATDTATPQRVLVNCGSDQHCDMAFLFRGRLAKMDDEYLYAEDSGAARALLFFSAWETLNRMHADASAPRQPTRELNRAQVAARACEAIGSSADQWNSAQNAAKDPSHGGDATVGASLMEQSKQAHSRQVILRRFATMEGNCNMAEATALRLGISSSEASEAIFTQVLHGRVGLARAEGSFEHVTNTAKMMISHASTAYGKKSRQLVEPVATLLMYGGAVPRELPESTERANALEEMSQLLDAYPKTLGEADRNRLYAAMDLQYAYLKNFGGEARLLSRQVKDLTEQYGSRSGRLLGPMHDQTTAFLRAGDMAGLSSALEVLQPYWAALPSYALGQAPEDYYNGWPMTGFDMVFDYTILAFNAHDFSKANAAIDQIIARMSERLGQDNPFVKAAMFHQREVRRRQRDDTLQVRGGGFLPPNMF